MNGKQNVVHPYNGILFSFFKEGDSDICYNIDEPDFMLSEISQLQNDKYWFNLYEVPKVVKIIETQKRMVVASSWEKGVMGCYH